MLVVMVMVMVQMGTKSYKGEQVSDGKHMHGADDDDAFVSMRGI